MVQRLDELLQSCTVKITVPSQMGWGTGFFVAPGLILTCAHVVKALSPGAFAQISWQQEGFTDAAIVECIHELDLALLRFSPPQNVNLPCVYLDREFQPTDNFYTYGYPDSFPDGASVTSQCEGDARESGVPLILFKSGLIRPGFSGSPLLNLRTGKVCGIVKFTRDRSIDLGGGAVPAAAILAQFPELIEQQRSFHQLDQRWSQRMQGAIAVNPVPSPAIRATLSLSAYDAATWVGRDSLVTALTQKLKDGCRILAMTGITGIGKTALAERLVVEASGDGVPFHRLNFDDRGQGRDFLSGALALLPKLGEMVTNEDQKDPQNALNHLLQTLRNQQFLMQIDSLEMLLQGDEQTGWNAFVDPLWVDFFQQLLAGESCQSQLLLTTQAVSEELEEIGARYPRYWYRQDVGGLSEVEQLALFEKNGLDLDDFGTETLRRIGALYQGHPLVIQVIAKDILDKPFNGNVQQYWQRYQAEFDEAEHDKQQGNSPRTLQLRVKQRVEKSLQRLPIDAFQILCCSSIYRRPVPEVFWLAMVGDLPQDKQWASLESLKSHNLAEEELRSDGVFLLRQHNLVKSVARQLLRMDKVAWQIAECTAAKVWLNAYEPEPGTSNLEKVRGYLEAFHHYCEVEDWEQAKEILIDQKVGDQLQTWGYCLEMLPLFERILGKLGIAVDVVCEKGLGNAYGSLSKYHQASDHYQRSLANAREIGDRQGEGSLLGYLGYINETLGNYHQAIEYHRRGLATAREINDRQGEGDRLAGLGNAHSCVGDYLQAIEYHQQSVSIVREINDREGECRALDNLGFAYGCLGNHPEAMKCHQQSVSIAHAIRYRRGECRALGNLGASYDSLGNYPQAIESHQQCLTIAREIGYRLGEGRALGNWGATLLKTGQYADAQNHLHTALEIFKALGNRSNEAKTLLRLGELHHKIGQPARAQKFCDRALAIATELGIPLVKECEELQALLAIDTTSSGY